MNKTCVYDEKKKERIYLTNEMTFLTFDILR